MDLAGLRNLIDPAEEELLRRCLSPAQFRTLERQRLRAAVEYVQRTAHNAAILLRLGEAVAQQGDPEAAAAAREMVNDALRLRVNAFLALGVLPRANCTQNGANQAQERSFERLYSLSPAVVDVE